MARSKGTTPRQKKVKKLGPKKALSAFMFFSKVKRQEILKKQPTLRGSVTEVSKIIGAAWKELNEGDKSPYVKEAADDKLRYAREKEEYDAMCSTPADAGEEPPSSSKKGGRKSPASRSKPAPKGRKKEEASEDDEEEEEEVNSDDLGDDAEDDGQDGEQPLTSVKQQRLNPQRPDNQKAKPQIEEPQEGDDESEDEDESDE